MRRATDDPDWREPATAVSGRERWFPQRSWLPPPPPPVPLVTSPPAPPEPPPPPPPPAPLPPRYHWTPCRFGGVPQHWSEENALPPPEQRPLSCDWRGFGDEADAPPLDGDSLEEIDGQHLAWEQGLVLGKAQSYDEAARLLQARRQQAVTSPGHWSAHDVWLMGGGPDDATRVGSNGSGASSSSSMSWTLWFLIVGLVATLVTLQLWHMGVSFAGLPGYERVGKAAPWLYLIGWAGLGAGAWSMGW